MVKDDEQMTSSTPPQRVTELQPLRPYVRPDMQPSSGVPEEKARLPNWNIKEISVESIPAKTKK